MFPAKGAVMMSVCRFLTILLLFTTSAFAQSEITIDRVGSEPVRVGDGAKSVAFTALIEGVVTNPELSVYVVVTSPGAAGERIFTAVVDISRPDSIGRYRWRAVCQFGELTGQGAIGVSYEAQAIAVNPSIVKRGRLLEALTASEVKSTVIPITRTRN